MALLDRLRHALQYGNILHDQSSISCFVPLSSSIYSLIEQLDFSGDAPADFTMVVAPITDFERMDLNEDKNAKIVAQIEYYFSDQNITHDIFMTELIKFYGDDGWLPVSELLEFVRLSRLSRDPDEIIKAIQLSGSRKIEVDDSFIHPVSHIPGRVRRHPSLPAPSVDQEEEIGKCVIVSGFPKTEEAKLACVDFFRSAFPKVVRVSAARNRESNEFTGSVFVTFETKEAAEEFTEEFSYNNEKLVYETSFLKVFPSRSNIKSNARRFSDTFDPDTIDRTVFVGGFDRTDLSDADLMDFVSNFEHVDVFTKREVTHDDGLVKFIGSIFITFNDKNAAEVFMGLTSVKFQGDEVIRKWQIDFYVERKLFLRRCWVWRRIQEYKQQLEALQQP